MRTHAPFIVLMMALSACDPTEDPPAPPEPPGPPKGEVFETSGGCTRGSPCSHFTLIFLTHEQDTCAGEQRVVDIELRAATWSFDQTTYGQFWQARAVRAPGVYTVGQTEGNEATIRVDGVNATSGTITVTSFALEDGRQRITGDYHAILPDGSERSGRFDAFQCRQFVY
jgi:hypothetical protein